MNGWIYAYIHIKEHTPRSTKGMYTRWQTYLRHLWMNQLLEGKLLLKKPAEVSKSRTTW